jgi:hypothetical protein
VLNFGRAFNVTVLIKVPVRLGGEHIWQEREDLQVADGAQTPPLNRLLHLPLQHTHTDTHTHTHTYILTDTHAIYVNIQ